MINYIMAEQCGQDNFDFKRFFAQGNQARLSITRFVTRSCDSDVGISGENLPCNKFENMIYLIFTFVNILPPEGAYFLNT